MIHKFTVDLPKKHGRGGQSALRFARLRMEKRHNYVRKVAEIAAQLFIDQATSKPNVAGIVLAGSADFKSELNGSDLFDPRLKKVVIKTVDVSYGMDNGFNQAIELSAETLGNVKLVQEKRLLQKYMDEISQDTGKYCFMVTDTLRALDIGAIDILIVWENLDIDRITVRNNSSGTDNVLHLTKAQQSDEKHFHDPETGVELEVVEKESLVEYFANNYKAWGATLEFVTNRSQEGSQFCRGFGGVGGILRWKVDFAEIDMAEENAADEDWDGEGF